MLPTMGKNGYRSKAALGLCAAALVAAMPAHGESGSASLALINPIATLSDMPIRLIKARLDGADFGGCSTGGARKPRICVKPTSIAPGPHVLELTLDPLTQTSVFRVRLDFTAAMASDWVVDLGQLAVEGAPQRDYFTITEHRRPASACLTAVEALAGISTCRVAALPKAEEALDKAVSACVTDARGRDKAALARALRQAFDNFYRLSPSRCYGEAELEPLPDQLTGQGPVEDFWPSGTAPASTWRWARELPAGALDNREVGATLALMQGVMPRLTARLDLVETFIDAYRKNAPEPLYDAARATPWSLDVATLDGRRDFLLLTDPGHFADPAFHDFVATAIAADPPHDCSERDRGAEQIMDFLTHGGTLSAAAWRAVMAMMQHVPADGDVALCAVAFEPTLVSPIAFADRLQLLGEFDCAAARPPPRRGQILRNFLQSAAETDEWDARQRLEHEFADCLAAAKP